MLPRGPFHVQHEARPPVDKGQTVRCYAIVGRRRSGKSTKAKAFVRSIAHPLPPLVYDVQREWGYGGPNLPTMEAFLEQVAAIPARGIGRVVVFEEAGIFFANNGRSELLTRILISTAHSRVTTVLVFHSLRMVPLHILELLNGLVLFKTMDTPAALVHKFKGVDSILNAWHEVNADPDPHASLYIPLQ